jgi:hypothetical protein
VEVMLLPLLALNTDIVGVVTDLQKVCCYCEGSFLQKVKQHGSHTKSVSTVWFKSGN